MKQLVLILCLLVALPFAGCHHGKDTASILTEAEALVYEYPDSALQLMESIPFPEQLTGKEQADYALLLSLAQYRCYIPATSDSLVRIAVQYYKDKEDADKKGMAYYVLGSILQECKEDLKTVIQAYKDAEQQVPHMTDLPTISRIYSRLGFLNQSASNMSELQFQYDRAILEKDNIRLYNRWLLSIGSFILLCTLFCFGAYQFYQCKKKELSDLNNTLSVLEAEKRQLETVNKEMDGYRMTKAEREERLESLNQEIKTLQNKERRLKDAIKRMDTVKDRIYSSPANDNDVPFNVYQSLTRQGIYHPSTDRPHLKNFLNQLFYQFADRLSSQYPTLKDRDLDICYMMALQLNPDEMAQIFNISTDSIKRYIRKITKEMQSISQDSMSLEERINLFKRRY